MSDAHEDFQARLATFTGSMPQVTEKQMDKTLWPALYKVFE